MNKAITIGAAVMMSLSLAACGNTSSTSSTSHTTSSQKAAPKYYKVGDSVKVGKVTYTLKSVEVTNERNEFEDNQPKNVIKVVYHVKNNSDKDLPIGTDLDAYGPDNTKLKSYPVDDTTLDAIAPGKEADVTTGFGTDKLGTFELQFSPFASTDKPAKFRVKVKATNASNSNSNNNNSQQPTASQGQSSNQGSQQASQTKSSDNGKATVAGHTFHRENFYGTDIWVGDNNEGELGEWAANDPSIYNNDSAKQQIYNLNNGGGQ